MLKGLEISILPFNVVKFGNDKLRIDSGYFTKEAIEAERLVEALPNTLLGDLASTFRKGIFDIKADTYVNSGEGVPFIRITDIKSGMIQKHSTAWISSEAHELESKTALKFGDLILSKTAYPAASIVNLPECNASQDTIAVRLTADAQKNYRTGFIAAFLNAKHGLALMARRFQGNVQQHLSLEDGRSLRIPRFSLAFQDLIHELVLGVNQRQDSATALMSKAEERLLDALGVANWTPSSTLTYTASVADVFDAERIDAQFFRPQFKEIEAILAATGKAVELGQILLLNSRGRQPKYNDVGLPVINSKHVRTNRIIWNDNRLAIENGSPVIIQKGDVLVNGTGVGTIGRAAPYLHDQRALPDNHVTILRGAEIDPVYLSVFLNSPLGQSQMERHIRGSSGQIELYPNDIARVVVWIAPAKVQKEVRNALMSAFHEERRANEMLDAAERAVEIAIESGEDSAVRFLNKTEEAV